MNTPSKYKPLRLLLIKNLGTYPRGPEDVVAWGKTLNLPPLINLRGGLFADEEMAIKAIEEYKAKNRKLELPNELDPESLPDKKLELLERLNLEVTNNSKAINALIRAQNILVEHVLKIMSELGVKTEANGKENGTHAG